MNTKSSCYRAPTLFGICFLLFGVCISMAQKPELVVQTGHSAAINSASFSPDGRYLITGSVDNTAKLWEVNTGLEIRTFAGHFNSIQSVSFSPDGKYVITGSFDKTAKLWDITAGQEILTLRGDSGWINSASFSPDGKYVVTGSVTGSGRDGTAKLWDITTGKEIHTFHGHSGDIQSVSFSPDGKYVVTGSKDKTAKLWKVTTGQEIITLRGHSEEINSASFSPDGKYVVTGSEDKTAKLWEVTAGKKIRTFTDHYSINSVSFSPDSRYVVTGNSDGTAQLWEIAAGQEIRTFSGHSYVDSVRFTSVSNSVNSVSFSPDGKYVVTGSYDKTAKLWEVTSGQEIRTFARHSSPIHSVSFSPDGKYVVTGRQDITVNLWEIATGREIRTFAGHFDQIFSVNFSRDGKYLVTGSMDGAAKLWEVTSGQEIHAFGEHPPLGEAPSGITSVDFSPEGKYVVTGSWDYAKLWEVKSGKKIHTFRGHSMLINSVSFSPDGKYVVTGSQDKTAKLWEVTTGEEIRTLRGHSVGIKSVSFSPDGKYVVTGSWDATAKLWELTTGKNIRTLREHLPINSVSFSPDGKYVATGSGDTAKLWEVNFGKETLAFRGHVSQINSVSFSRDGKYLLTGSDDATTKIWEVNTGREIVTLISIGDNDWVVRTTENFYAASKGTFKGVAFRVGNKAFPFEQFDLRLNRPDRVLSKIGRAPQELIDSYYQAYQKRLKRMKFTEDMLGDDFHLPEIAIASGTPPVSTQNKMLQFKIKASDTKYFLDRLNVYVNDVPVYGSNGIDLRDKKTQTHEQDISLELSAGRNKIQTSALNDKGTESLRETFEVVYEGKPVKPDLYLIAIGVSEYVDSRFNLKWAAKDADDLAKIFATQKDRFAKIATFKISDRNATKENILKLKDILMRTKVDDEVVLFVAGHGLLDKNLDYYFATSDIDFANPAAKGLSYEAIEGLLEGIPARKKLLLMDTCHSGEVDKDETILVAAANTARSSVKSRSFRNVVPISRTGKLGLSNSFQLMQELFANLSRGSGAVVISAASGVEYAYEDQQWQNGVFTYCVLEGLATRNADLNKDNEIRVSELKDYVTEKVQQLTQGRQTPTSRRENLEFDFRVF